MRAIHRFATQYVIAWPSSLGPRALRHEVVFRPRFWRLPLADATSVQSLFFRSLGSLPDVLKAGVQRNLRPLTAKRPSGFPAEKSDRDLRAWSSRRQFLGPAGMERKRPPTDGVDGSLTASMCQNGGHQRSPTTGAI